MTWQQTPLIAGLAKKKPHAGDGSAVFPDK